MQPIPETLPRMTRFTLLLTGPFACFSLKPDISP
jgi:hypothetical protein